MTTGRAELAWVLGGSAFAVFIGFSVISQPLALPGLAALAALGLIVWRPAAVPIGVLVVTQEINPALFPGAPASMVLGHQVYFADVKVPPIVLLFAVSALAVSAHLVMNPERHRTAPAGRFFLVVSLSAACVVTLVNLFAGQSLAGALNQDARPFFLVAAGFLIGIGLRALPGEPRASRRVVSLAIVFLAGFGALTAATGRGASIDGSSLMVFYDSALPAIAGAVALAVLTATERRRSELIVAVAGLLIVVISLRRGVWLGIAFALFVAALATPSRGRLVARVLGGGALLAGFGVLVPPVRNVAVSRIADALHQRGDATVGHLNDLTYGWMYVRQSPMWGVGPRHEALPGLAARTGRLYVHNDWLLAWLRYGILGALLITAILAALCWLAVRRLRQPDTTTEQRVAAYFAIIVPAACFTAPFITTTSRWPALLGLAGGILAVSHATPGEHQG